MARKWKWAVAGTSMLTLSLARSDAVQNISCVSPISMRGFPLFLLCSGEYPLYGGLAKVVSDPTLRLSDSDSFTFPISFLLI